MRRIQDFFRILAENSVFSDDCTPFRLFVMNRFFKVLAFIFIIPIMIPSGVYWIYSESGRSPGELVDYAERRLQGHTRLEAVLSPVFSGLRRTLNARSQQDRQNQQWIVPLPPKPWGNPTQQTGWPDLAVKHGHILRVGPDEAIQSINLAARLAHDGDTVEIQAGEYHADVASWPQKNLIIRGVGGNARIFADGRSAEGKAIWVIRDGTFHIENIDFIGARVPDHNGAGIRFEKGNLHIRNCLFYANENGLLATGGDAELSIENSEFAYNGSGDGQSHNLYVGNVRSLKVTGSYFHHANVGHLLKSRASYNYIAYNRLTDEIGGRASYELEFPNGGIAYVIGNIIQQGSDTENSTLISYGAEKYPWPKNSLYLASNSLVNDLPRGGSFLRVYPGVQRVVSMNNLLIGVGEYHAPDVLRSSNDIHAEGDIFIRAARQDYRLNDAGRKLSFQPPLSGLAEGVSLIPFYEYVHPRQIKPLVVYPTVPGALQMSVP